MPQYEPNNFMQNLILGAGGGIQRGLAGEVNIRKEMFKEQLRRTLNPEEAELKRQHAEYYKRAGMGTATKPVIKQVGNTLLRIEPETGKTDVLFTTPDKPPKPSFREDLKKFKGGELSIEEIKDLWPETKYQKEIENLRKSSLPIIKKSPQFRVGTGGAISKVKSFFKPTQAELNSTTIKVIEQIKNEEDLQELLERKDEARVKGIDVDAILEYFGVKK